MKKILFVLTIFCFSATAVNAQTKKATETAKPVEVVKKTEETINFIPVDAVALAKVDATDIKNLLNLDDIWTQNFYRLFEQKYKAQNENLSLERKTGLNRIIEGKIRASLNPEQMAKLEAKEELFKRLVN